MSNKLQINRWLNWMWCQSYGFLSSHCSLSVTGILDIMSQMIEDVGVRSQSPCDNWQLLTARHSRVPVTFSLSYTLTLHWPCVLHHVKSIQLSLESAKSFHCKYKMLQAPLVLSQKRLDIQTYKAACILVSLPCHVCLWPVCVSFRSFSHGD